MAVIFLMVGLSTSAAMAQQVAVAQLDGYVSDPSGQMIAGAQVKAIEVDRDQVHSATTDSTGHYAFPGLPAGNYKLEVASAGFKGTSRPVSRSKRATIARRR
jgi:hypothetical protein